MHVLQVIWVGKLGVVAMYESVLRAEAISQHQRLRTRPVL